MIIFNETTVWRQIQRPHGDCGRILIWYTSRRARTPGDHIVCASNSDNSVNTGTLIQCPSCLIKTAQELAKGIAYVERT